MRSRPAGAVDLDRRADRQRAAVAAVGLGCAARARAVGGLAEVDVRPLREDEVRGALPAVREGHHAGMNGGLGRGRPRRGGGRREHHDRDCDQSGADHRNWSSHQIPSWRRLQSLVRCSRQSRYLVGKLVQREAGLAQAGLGAVTGSTWSTPVSSNTRRT